MTTVAETDRLLELAATNLGVIEHLGLVFEPGMTAITGETGAGKTLLLTALELLIGGRADVAVVGPHGDEAVVEGRFIHDGDELVLQRIVPRDGRSRAYVNGRLATAGTLSDYGAQLVELHGQHAHTALTATSAQRAALDVFGAIDLEPLIEARMRERELVDRLEGLGGDDRQRLRELELLRFQVDEIDHAQIASPLEDDELRAEEALLAGSTDNREAAAMAASLLGADGAVDDGLATVTEALAGKPAFDGLADRVASLAADLADVAADARSMLESIEDDPERLAAIQERRRVLTGLRRKYGETLAEVLDYHDRTAARVGELEDRDRVAAELEAEIESARATTRKAATKVGRARRRAAPELAVALTANVRELALPNAHIECHVGDDPGDDVELQISMNKGAPLQPLSKIASGGELARTMLATRLVLSADPATMVFDEVDAGVGGAAAQAVGAALGRLGQQRQVLVVTHLAQVAAHADNHVTVVKDDSGKMVSVAATVLDAEARIVELSRMLSGSPGSHSAREHAAELLADAASAKLSG